MVKKLMGFRYQSTMEKGLSSTSSSSSSSSSGGGGGDSINGLTFGKKIYFEGGAGSGSHPAKRGRTGVAAQGGQPPRCQVEGCNVDLSDAKAYYCRHKVCGMHSKYPKVIVAGIEQRFCQQCSRFHQLPEFDQGKRSCRRRLAGHNERRRKPPPGPLPPSRYGSLSTSTFDNHSRAGGFVMDFNGYSTSVTGRDSWPITSSGGGLANQVTVAQKYEQSWPRTSQNPLPNNVLPDPASRPGIRSEGCFNRASDYNTGALSLLSNESWSSRNQRALSLGVSSFLGTGMVQPSFDDPIGQFSYAPWGFKDNQGDTSINEMAPDMGLSAISNQTSNAFFRGDLELAQPSDRRYHGETDPSRVYASPAHHMHWSH